MNRRWIGLLIALPLCQACAREPATQPAADGGAGKAAMISRIKAYGVNNKRVLAAMSTVRRPEYIPEPSRAKTDPYGDHPSPIGYGQTISQPFIVAYMTERIDPQPGEKILEIGTGSGYQAAILAELGAEVFSIEIVPELAEHARRVLASEGYTHAHVLTGDGYKGWPEHAPFDSIIVTCAPEEIPQTLVDQLREGGRMIVPVGNVSQRLMILRKLDGRVRIEEDLPVVFVPMVHGGQTP